MRLVRQPNNASCGAACVAMLLDVSYDKAVELVGTDGITTTRDWTVHVRGKIYDPIGAIYKPDKSKYGRWTSYLEVSI